MGWIKKISLLVLIALLIAGCGGGRSNLSSLTVKVRLPEKYQNAFFLQSESSSMATELFSHIKYARITVEGPGITPPISKDVPFGSVVDVVVPSGNNRLFTVALMDKDKKVIFMGYKLVPYLPEGKEVSIDLQLSFARVFTDAVGDIYPEGFKGFDLKNVSMMWGGGEKKSIRFIFTFNKKVELSRGVEEKGLFGLIEIDADGNPATGIPSVVDSLRRESKGKIGVDYIVYLEGFSRGGALLYNVKDKVSSFFPVKIFGKHLMLEIPVSYFKEISPYGDSIFYVDSVFMTGDGEETGIDFFPDNAAAVSSSLLFPPYLRGENLTKISKFVLKERIPLPPGVKLAGFYPYQSGDLFGAVYMLSYSPGTTFEVGVRITNLYTGKVFNHVFARIHGIQYFTPVFVSSGNLVVLAIQSDSLGNCGGGGGLIAFLSGDGGYTFKQTKIWCPDGYVYNAHILNGSVLFEIENYSAGGLAVFKRFTLENGTIVEEPDLTFDFKGMSYPSFFVAEGNFYETGVSVQTDRTVFYIYPVTDTIPLFSDIVTDASGDGYVDFVKVAGRRVFVVVTFYPAGGYGEGFHLLYALTFTQDGTVKLVDKKYLSYEAWIMDVLPFSDGLYGILENFGGATERYVFDFRGQHLNPFTVSNGYITYFGSWILPPATPMLFWEDETGKTLNVSVGVP